MWNNFRQEVLQIEKNIEDGRNGMYARPDGNFSAWRQIGQTFFQKLANLLTRGQLDKRNCVDYMVDTMVKDNFFTIKKVIQKHVFCVEKSKSC